MRISLKNLGKVGLRPGRALIIQGSVSDACMISTQILAIHSSNSNLDASKLWLYIILLLWSVETQKTEIPCCLTVITVSSLQAKYTPKLACKFVVDDKNTSCIDTQTLCVCLKYKQRATASLLSFLA